MKLRIKVDEYLIWEKGRGYSVLVFPFIKNMWAYDDRPEMDRYMVDGSAEAFSMLKYAMAIMVQASDKIIYFPCKQDGDYNLVLCTPKAQLRRSSWIAIRKKISPATKRGTYTLRYNRKKLDDYCEKMLFEKDSGYRVEERYPRPEISKKMEKEHLEELLGENLFMVLSREECYYNHYYIARNLDKYKAGGRDGIWSKIGWIATQRGIAELHTS